MMHCKDILEAPILERIYDINVGGSWVFRWWLDNVSGPQFLDAFPDGKETPDKLVVAKMAKLIKRGLVKGCDCGCRGDYVITAKGAEVIGRPPQTIVVGY